MKTFRHIYDDPILCHLEKEEVDGKRHYIAPSGRRLTSVTTFLSHFKSDSIRKWQEKVGQEEAEKIKTRASLRGREFHSFMESYLGNHEMQSFINEDTMPSSRQAFMDMVPTLDRIDNIHYIEAMLYSEDMGLAGQVDCIAEFDGVPSVIDFKTSMKLKREDWITNYFEQCTAYSYMYQFMTNRKIEQIVVLISVDHETKPQVFVKNRKDYTDSLYQKLKEFHAL